MGLKKFFKIKPPEEATPEQNKDTLMELGISVKNPSKKRKEKFAAYGKFANDKAEDKVYAPPGYEQYARPQDELEDLNASPLDVNANEATAGSNRGSSGTQNLGNGAESNSMQDPYAIENDDYRYDDDPYARFQANKSNGRGSVNAVPYGDYGGGYNGTSLNSYNNDGPYSNQNTSNSWVNANGRNSLNHSNSTLNAGPSRQTRQPPVSTSTNSLSLDQRSPLANPMQEKRNPYADMNSYGGAYDSNTNRSSGTRQGSSKNANPYASMANDSYSNGNLNRSANPYSSRSVRQPQSQQAPMTYTPSFIASDEAARNSEVDLNEEPRTGEFDFEEVYADKSAENRAALDEPDLNAVMTNEDSIDLNASEVDHRSRQQQQQQWFVDEQQQQQQHFNATNNQYGDQRGYKTFEEIQKEEEARQQQEEDEAVDEIKQEIKFTKQSSVASTRNTLKMAQDAERAGMNTLGMLGHQSEQLNNVEGNLDLMKVQNKVADEKVAELKKLNRSILAVHVSNPFNSKRRRREREEQLKNRKIEEKLMREQTSQQLSQSTQRIEGAMNANNNISEVRERYQRKNVLEKAKRYQFENDEEDDEMELEIDRNLDQIQQVSNRLKKMALTTGKELDSQQKRLNNIEESTDDLDINLHMNTNRLAGIR
ncbi:BDH_1b_G0020290.mRNA.1.CDS.1 [Saccharomyces cerevisiae]|nr:Sec9p [Saccharomyces cerevisiae YJM693]CAI4475633.1 BDH_1b_G0020290.mRNA.1.CDS.1 [Saccharomyces cerevisiae]CAI7123621.1 BDH_1b_G0020290.mRNA.1.CDS.1 [Saccharomyces cerevisiae]